MITPEQVTIEIVKLFLEFYLILVFVILVLACLFMAWYAPNWSPLEVLK